MEEETPRNDRRSTENLESYSAKEITVLPASVLGPIIRQATIDGGSNEPTEDDIKQAIDMVRLGHWVPGLPKKNNLNLGDLYANDV